MGTDSRLENLQVQAVRDALKGNAKQSRRISGTARDVLKAAQWELQRERSLDFYLVPHSLISQILCRPVHLRLVASPSVLLAARHILTWYLRLSPEPASRSYDDL